MLLYVHGSIAAPPPPRFELFQVKLSSDGNYLIAGGTTGFALGQENLYFFDCENGDLLWAYPAGAIYHLSISSDGSYIVAGTSGVELFDITGNQIWNYPSNPRGLSISSDASTVAALAENKLLFFNRENNIPVWSAEIPNMERFIFPFTNLSISDDGSYVLATYFIYIEEEDHSRAEVHLFTENGIQIWSYLPTSSLFIGSFAEMSSDGSYIALIDLSSPYITSEEYGENYHRWTTARYPRLCFFSKAENIPVWTYDFVGEKTRLPSVSISSDGNCIVASTSAGIYLFNKAENIPLWIHPIDNAAISDDRNRCFVKISSDGNYIVVVDGRWRPGGPSPPQHSFLYLLSKSDNTPLWSRTLPGEILSASISSDGERIAAFSSWNHRFGTIYVFSRDGVEEWSYTIELKSQFTSNGKPYNKLSIAASVVIAIIALIVALFYLKRQRARE